MLDGLLNTLAMIVYAASVMIMTMAIYCWGN